MMLRLLQCYAIARRELTRFLTVPFQTVLTPLISSSLYLLIFGVSLGEFIELDTQFGYLAFLIPGLVTMGSVRNAFENSASTIIGGKYMNELQDLKTTPLPTTVVLWGIALSSTLRGLMVAILTFMVGQVFLWASGMPLLEIYSLGTLAFFLAFGSFTFAIAGVAVGIVSKGFEQVGIITSFVLTPLIYLGGVFFPLTKLHPFWRNLSEYNPFLYIINGVRYGAIGKSDVLLSASVGVLFCFFVLSYFFAYRGLKDGNNYTR